MTSERRVDARLGYLISQYPAVNHTFILREILTLRAQGMDIHAVSVRRADRSIDKLSADEAEEQRRTFSVMGAGAGHAFAAQLRTFLRRPLRYLRTLAFAWSLTRGTPRLLLPYTLYFAEAVVAGEYFEKHGVKHVHCHFSSTVLLIASRLFPIRYSVTLHGPDEFNDVVGFHLAEKVAGAEFISTISHYASSQVMKASDPAHWHKVRTLRLGVDPSAFSPRPAPSRAAGEPFRMVMVGRLAPAKAQHILIRMVAALKAAGRNVELTLVGAGPSHDSLAALVRELGLGKEVVLAGACNHDRVADYYRRSDAFVLASFAEGVPVVLMEAMAMEVPCIATWITGIPELITHEVDGILVPPASVEALVEAVSRLMDDPALAARIGPAGRRKVIGNYHLEANARKLGVVIEACVPSAASQAG